MLDPGDPTRGTIVVATDRQREGERVEGGVALEANQGVVLALDITAVYGKAR